MKPKLLIVTDSAALDTGMGRGCREIMERLHVTGRYELAQLAWFHPEGQPYPFPWKMFKTDPRLPYGHPRNWPESTKQEIDECAANQVLNAYQPSHVLIFADAWMGDYWNKLPSRSCFKLIWEQPLDGVDIPSEWVKDFRNADAPICMTQFAINEFVRHDPFIKIGLIPRGINLANFYPEKDKNALREKFCKPLVGKFVIGWVDRNQSRKNVPAFLEACRLFIQDKDDVMVYMHCCPDDSMGWDLKSLIPKFGLDGRVAFTKGLRVEKGVPDSMMRIVYNLFDIKVSTTQGEGFGLCVTPDTIIHSLNGPKPIADIEVGDKVLTKDGNFKPVLGKKVRQIKEQIYKIQTIKNKREIKCTEGERFLGIKTKKCIKGYGICKPNCQHRIWRVGQCKHNLFKPYQLDWLSVENLKKWDALVFPKIKIPDELPQLFDLSTIDFALCKSESKIWYSWRKTTTKRPTTKYLNRFIKLNDDLFRLIGLYLAEGCNSANKHSISFAFSIREIDLHKFVLEKIKEIFGIDGKIRLRGNWVEVYFNSIILVKIFKSWCGDGAYNKCIHPLFFKAPKFQLRALIRGLWDGDGSDKHLDGFQYSTVSPKLAYQMWEILNNLGILANLRFCKSRHNLNYPEIVLEVFGEFLNRMSEILKINPHRAAIKRKHAFHHRYWEDENYWYLPITKVEKEHYEGEVVDLWIDGEHSFAAEGAIVHNTNLEAMACGIPTITTNYAGSAELVRDAGAVVDVKDFVISVKYSVPRANIDVQKLVEIMNLYYYSLSLRQLAAQACWQRAQHYDWNRIMPKWFQVLDLLNPRPLYVHLDKLLPQDETFARLAAKEKLEVNLTGAVNENTSWALFNRALARGLKALGHNVSIKPECWPSSFPLSQDLVQMVQRPLNLDVDIIHHHGAFMDYLKRSKAKVKIVFMPWEVTEFPYKWVEEINRHADGFWTVSEHSAKIAEKNGVDHDMISVIPAGTNFDLFNPQIKPKELQTNKKYKFLCVGNLVDSRKNVTDLLRAYLHTFTNKDDVVLVLKSIGGDIEDVIRQEVRGLNDYPEVLYIYKEESVSEMAGYYTACDCFVFPTKAEGFGSPVLEALACGLPVISTHWSAHLSLLPKESPLFLRFEMVPSKLVVDGVNLPNAEWAEPEIEHLKLLLRKAYSEKLTRKPEVSEIIKPYSWENSAKKAEEGVRKAINFRAKNVKIKVFFETGVHSLWNQANEQALKRYAPPIFEFVQDYNKANIQVLNFTRLSDVNKIVLDDNRFILLMHCHGMWSEEPHPQYTSIFKRAKMVYSHLDLTEHKLTNVVRGPWGVEPQEFYHEPRFANSTWMILCTGAVAETEGISECVTATAEMTEKCLHLGPDMRFNSPAYVNAWKDLGRQCTLEEMRKFYSQSRFVSALRRVEGFEKTFAEGLLCGARPICFDTPLFRYWYDGFAEFVPERGHDEVVKALKPIFQKDPNEVAVRRQERLAVIEKFSWVNVAKNFWKEVFKH